MLLFFRAGFWLAVGVTLYLTLRPAVAITTMSDKTQHLISFGVLTLLAGLAYPRARLLPLGIVLSGLGAIIELLQPFSGRTNDIKDWIADTAGVLLAIFSVWTWRRLTSRLD